MDAKNRTKESLKEEMKELVAPGAYARGENYYTDGLVGKIELYSVGRPGKVGIKATVFGTKEYATSLTFSGQEGFSAVRCTCPYEWGYCKHAVALGLKYLTEVYDPQDASLGNKNEEKKELVDATDLDVGMFFANTLRAIKEKGEDGQGKHLGNMPMDGHGEGVYSGERFEDKYSLVLSRGYRTGELRLEMTDEKKNTYHYGVPYAEILRKESGNITEDQENLLRYLEGTGREGALDAGIALELAKRSSIGIYWGRKSKSNELSFNEIPPEIRAKLSLKKTVDKSSGGGDSFVYDAILALDGGFCEGHATRIFSGNDRLISIEENVINVYPSTRLLSGVLSRIFKTVYDEYVIRGTYKSRWEAKLDEDEIIRLRELISDMKSVFVLNSEFSKDLTIKEHEKAKPLIVVDFDTQTAELRVTAMMDYGFERVDIASTCFRSVKNGHISFQRKTEPGREKYRIKMSREAIEYAPLDIKKELEIFGKLYTDNRFGFTKALACSRKGNRQVLAYLENNWPHIKKTGYPIEFTNDEIECTTENFKADINIDFNAENDLLAFDLECYCGEDKIGLADLRKYIESNGSFIRTGDGKLLKVGNREELEKFIRMLESFHQKESQRFEGKAYSAPELDTMIAESKYYNTKVSESFRDFMSEVQNGRPVEEVTIPSDIGAILRHYQKEGIDWFYFLRKYRFGGVLADDMGLGKTLQALLLIHMNKEEGKPTLVICPKTLLFNWQDEALKFFPEMKTMIVEGSPKERGAKIKNATKYDLVVTSFSALKKDADIYEKMKLRFNYCIIDEAQFIKNHNTQSAKAVKKIDADYRLAMTGTPLENSISEIWSIFDFVMPGFLGSYSAFRSRFETPIMKQSDAEVLAALRSKIACFMLRRSKSAVLKELPTKIEQIAHCQLGDHQNILYQEILANTKKEILDVVKTKGFARSQIHILAALMKLRQVCNHPALLLKDADHKKYESAKLDLFMELVDEIMASNRKVLVFSQFTSMLDILAKEMKAKEIHYNYLSGKTQNRKELVDDFNTDPDKKVFLISLKAGGTGLNLVSADNVIIFDPWWNPSVENQAIDRAHRIGQKNSVNVYKLVTKGTIEEKILKLQEKKKFLFDNLVDESEDLFKTLTWDEVRELFD